VEHSVVQMMIHQLRSSGGPLEQVISEWDVPPGITLSIPADSPVHEAGYAAAFDLIDELRRELGPTGDPSWVDDIVPGRAETGEDRQDLVFALFRHPPAYVYVRLRGRVDAASHLRLIAGVVAIPKGHRGHQ
jgi:hypothetical protein